MFGKIVVFFLGSYTGFMLCLLVMKEMGKL